MCEAWRDGSRCDESRVACGNELGYAMQGSEDVPEMMSPMTSTSSFELGTLSSSSGAKGTMRAGFASVLVGVFAVDVGVVAFAFRWRRRCVFVVIVWCVWRRYFEDGGPGRRRGSIYVKA